MINLIPVDEHDDVSVLLDRTRLTQVRVDRALVGSLFKGAVELGERHHRRIELLGQRLERARDFGNLVGPVFRGAADLHQLQVIDHDQTDLAMLTHYPSRPGPHLHRRQSCGIVNEQFAVIQQIHR